MAPPTARSTRTHRRYLLCMIRGGWMGLWRRRRNAAVDDRYIAGEGAQHARGGDVVGEAASKANAAPKGQHGRHHQSATGRAVHTFCLYVRTSVRVGPRVTRERDKQQGGDSARPYEPNPGLGAPASTSLHGLRSVRHHPDSDFGTASARAAKRGRPRRRCEQLQAVV